MERLRSNNRVKAANSIQNRMQQARDQTQQLNPSDEPAMLADGSS